MTDREAMQQALDALETLAHYENPETKIQVRKPKKGGMIVTMYPHKVASEAAEVLRERLARQEDEQPKETLERLGAMHGYGWCQSVLGELWERKHQCAPRGRMGVTAKDAALQHTRPQPADEPVAWNKGVPPMLPQQKEGETFIASYEQQPADEPVAWSACGVFFKHRDLIPEHMLHDATPLYTRPQPAAQWVGLTDEERLTAIWTDGTFGAGVEWAEAKLKEKNT